MKRLGQILLVGCVVMAFLFSVPGEVFAQTATFEDSGIVAGDPTPAGGIVPAGRDGNYEAIGYGPCEFVGLVNNLIQFLIGLSALLAVIVFIYAGYLMVASRGNTAQVQQAKGLFTNVAIGFVIMLTAFLIINTILSIMVGSNSGILNWQTVECTYAKESTPPRDIEVNLFVHEAEQIVSTGDGSTVLLSGSQGGQGGGGSSNPVTASACDESSMSSVNFLGSRVTVQENLIPSLERIDSAWKRKGGQQFYRVTSVGGYACRKIANSGKMSNHSYGIAIDINPVQNPHTKDGVCHTNMPAEFVRLFTSEGWGWGCNWNSSKDAMHYSKASGEGGNMSF